MIKRLLFVITIALYSSIIVAQTRYYVSVGGSGTMDGLSWANSTTLENSLTLSSSNDEIWIQSGTYLINSTLEVSGANLYVYGGFEGSETDLSQRDYTSNTTILDGQNTTKIMRFSSRDGILDGITFANGFVTGSLTTDDPTFNNDGGGALRVTGTNSMVRNCTFRDNVSESARGGGAIFIWFGNSQIIDNCIFENNSRVSGYEGNGGGAIHNWNTDVIIRNSTFKNNTSVNTGGAIYTWGHNLSLENCVFENNSSEEHGGGVYVNNNGVTVSNCIFRDNNSIGNGGGISNSGSIDLINNIFYNNSSDNLGGAIFNNEEVNITNSSFISNTSTAIVHSSHASSAFTPRVTKIYNSIFYNNLSKDNDYFADVSVQNPATATDLSDNDFRYNIFQETPFGSDNLINIDPLFVDNNNDFSLQTNSLAVNIGNNELYNTVAGETAASSVDLAQQPRLFDNNIDLGAYETQVTSTLTVPDNCSDLVSPLNGAENVSVNLNTISWAAVSGAVGYRVSINGSISNVNDIVEENIPTTFYDFTNNFEYNEIITITIIPYNAIGDALGCTEQSFTTETIIIELECTDLVSPLENETNVPVDTDITWNAVPNAAGYYLSIGTDSGVWDILDTYDVGNSTTFNLPNDLPASSEIFLIITPYIAINEPLISCDEKSFGTETIATVPNCTTLSSPVHGSVGVSVTSDITWNTIPDADGYYLTIGTTTGGNDILPETSITATTFNLPSDLPDNTEIFVSIVPYNSTGSAIGCNEESFTTETLLVLPGCTTLTMPLAGETNVSVATNFSWNAVENASGYLINIGDNDNFYGEYDAGNALTFDLPYDLPFENTLVHVRIIPYDSEGNENHTCVYESFTTGAIPTVPDCTTLTLPLDGATDVPLDTAITWDAVENASGYFISIGTSSGSSDVLDNFDIGNTTTYNPEINFNEDLTTVYVQITPYNENGEAVNCTEASFTFREFHPIACAYMTTPSPNATNVPIDIPLIIWNPPEPDTYSVAGYYLSIGLSPDGGEILDYVDVGNGTSYNLLESLPENTEIFVTVVPFNNDGIAAGCTSKSFTTETVTVIPEPDNTKYGFSPDGNGINDFWKIDGIQNYPNNEVMIYNRWGDLVFSIKGYDNNSKVFRGEANKKTKLGAGKLPSGTYFFNIHIDGNHHLKKTQGFVVLKR